MWRGALLFSSAIWFAALGLGVPPVFPQDPGSSPPSALETPGEPQEGERAAGRTCLACGKEVPPGADGIVLVYRGRHVFLHGEECPECLRLWAQDPEALFRRLQARSALFDEGPGAQPSPLASGWLLFGVYALVGLVVGGLTAGLALTRGHRPLPWFFAGLFLNVLGLAALILRGQGDVSSYPQGVPRGLRKIPSTHAPVSCPGCRQANHPAASVCDRCGSRLTPQVATEVPTPPSTE